MTLREAYEAFCDFRRGMLVDYAELEEAMLLYMDLVDDLYLELDNARRGNVLLQKKLKSVTKLKEKYYKELKDIYGLGCAGKDQT